VACSAIGGSTNAPIHINAIARHVGVNLSIEDWETIGYDVPLIVNMQPAGKYLGEEYHRAGGLPAVMHELLKAKRLHADALTINGKTIGGECPPRQDFGPRRHPPLPPKQPLKERAGFKVLRATVRLRDHEDQRDPPPNSATAICPIRRTRMRSRAARWCSTARRTITRRVDDPALKIDEHTMLFHPRRRADRLSGLGGRS